MSTARWIWAGWIIFGIVYEFVWLFSKNYKNTLSEFIWHICKVTPGQTILHWTAIHLFVFFFLLWLLLHITFSLFR